MSVRTANLAGGLQAPMLAYPDVAAFANAVGIGRTMVYEEIKAGRLRVAKVGRRTLVPVAEAQRWLTARVADAERAA